VKPEKRWVDVVKSNIEALEEKDETPEGAAPEGGEEIEEAEKEDKQTDDAEKGGESPSNGDEDVKSAEVKALEEKVESLENNETELKGKLEAKDQEISDLKEQLETAENNLEAKEEEMKEYL
jgi:predicted RNase H-like nuclease (RuvC/YqgF family)